MTKLEEKLEKLGYELSMTQTIYKPSYQILKTYCKELEDNFAFINVANNKICKIINVPQKDLEVLEDEK